ncbi:hypothetical protein AAK706_06355 [Erysipelotrichaceae bacterium 66-17]
MKNNERKEKRYKNFQKNGEKYLHLQKKGCILSPSINPGARALQNRSHSAAKHPCPFY